MDLHHSNFLLHNPLFHYHLLGLFLVHAGPDCRASSSADSATDDRAAGATDLRTNASAYAAPNRSSMTALVLIACRYEAREAKAE